MQQACTPLEGFLANAGCSFALIRNGFWPMQTFLYPASITLSHPKMPLQLLCVVHLIPY